MEEDFKYTLWSKYSVIHMVQGNSALHLQRSSESWLNMRSEKFEFLNLRYLPARLTVEQTAWLLGFACHDIPVLITCRLLKPLGNPPSNGTKYFSLATIEEVKADSIWLSRASNAIVLHWKKKNAARSFSNETSEDNSSSNF